MDDARIKVVYEALDKLTIELDPNPAARGPAYLQDLISKTRGYLNETSHYLMEVLRETREGEMRLEALEAAFQVASDELLANDRRVTGLPAVQDRLAMINVLLASDCREIRSQKRTLKNLGHVERVVRHRHKELENTMSAIRLQRSLLETEVRTGSFYGDENETSRGTRWPKTREEDDLDGDAIERLMKEELTKRQVVETEEEEEVPAPVASAASVDGEDPDFADLMEAVQNVSGSTPAPQPVVGGEPVPHKPLGSNPEEVLSDDPDIQKFLTGEDDDDLFKNL